MCTIIGLGGRELRKSYKKLISYDMLWFKVHVYLFFGIVSLFCQSRKSHFSKLLIRHETETLLLLSWLQFFTQSFHWTKQSYFFQGLVDEFRIVMLSRKYFTNIQSKIFLKILRDDSGKKNVFKIFENKIWPQKYF